nr:uncharacterized protein LOC111511002 isoform X1 [Leptinotarsa decemlineata]XP_023022762.1 uncharacterized protein LOC111511002 isoform X1 [Leptinotarsa decemlineata]
MYRDIIFKLGIVISILVPYSNESSLDYVTDDSNSYGVTESSHVSREPPIFYQGVEGTPGVDFPIFSHIPKTIFSCRGLESGYYADLDTDCQVFHICEEEKKISFLCPNGTIFQQSDLICEWWFKVDCTNTPNLYEESAEQLRNDKSRRKSYRRVISGGHVNHGAIMRAEEVSSTSVKKSGHKYDNSDGFTEETSKRTSYNSNNTSRHVYEKDGGYSGKLYESNKQVVNGSLGRAHNSLRTFNDNALAHSKVRRFNDDQTGNYLNHFQEDKKNTDRSDSKSVTNKFIGNQKMKNVVQFQKHSKEYHVQFPVSNTGTDIYTISARKNEEHELKSKEESVYPDESNDKVRSDSDETQITEESSSFTKNVYNSIQDDSAKVSTVNPYPNHRITYSDLKTPNLSSSKVLNTISSVTPQYITTQPINNGKPFLGSRVGINITTTESPSEALPVFLDNNQNASTNSLYMNKKSKESSRHSNSTNLPMVKGSSEYVLITGVVKSESDGLTINSSNNSQFSSPLSTKLIENVSFAKNSNFSQSSTLPTEFGNERISTTIRPPHNYNSSETAFRKSVPSNQSILFSHNKAPNQKEKLSSLNPYVPTLELTTKTIDHATVYGSPVKINPTTPFPTRVGNTVQIKFDENVDKVGIHLTKYITSSSSKQVMNLNNTPSRDKEVQSSVNSTKEFEGLKNIIVDDNTNRYSDFGEENEMDSLRNEFDIDNNRDSVPVSRSLLEIDLKNKSSTIKNIDSVTTPTHSESHTSDYPILYVLLRNSTQQPRPFDKSHQALSSSRFNPSESYSYKVSSASPFKLPLTPESILPITESTVTPEIFERSNNMLNILKEISKIEQEYPSETPRPGLVIPPSVGPQTLHTLAIYFENALDQIASEKGVSSENRDNEISKEKLTHLLTEMTRHGYSQLFTENLETDKYTTELSSSTLNADENIDLGAQTSENLVQSPKIRELARNFTLALSSYLNDPDMFRKDLQDLRPTEPPVKSNQESTSDNEKGKLVDEELLNFSDSDPKLSLPAVFSTTSTPSSTWSFLLAKKATNQIEIDNSLNPDLNTADTQSFVPSFNNVNVESDQKQKNTSNFLGNHWTTSPSATKLWRNTFSINPAIVNDHLETAVTVSTSTESEFTEEYPLLDLSHENNENSKENEYEFGSLNSTEVHGLLIDFMNTTDRDSNVLHNILRKMNITEDEFLKKMRDIESNPLTRRLILLLISECGKEAARNADFETDHLPLERTLPEDDSQQLIHPSFSGNNEDTRALQLLNSLYSIASKFRK